MCPLEMTPDSRMFPDDTELDHPSMQTLLELDGRGFFPAPGEDEHAFMENVRRLRDSYALIDDALAAGQTLDSVVGFPIGEGTPIGPDVLSEAEEETRELFEFGIDWVPAYFLSKGLGYLWGGCTVVTDSDLALFFIRKDFQNREKWFIYNRRELLAHELCHVARSRLLDIEFEEHFAYMTATSSLRKFMGNCFRSEWDALIFLLPVFILLAAQILNAFEIMRLPEFPFWLIAASGPGFLFLRNAMTRRKYFHAEENLRRAGIAKPRAVLFRCTREEIHEIASSNALDVRSLLEKKSETELRFRMIRAKFLE